MPKPVPVRTLIAATTLAMLCAAPVHGQAAPAPVLATRPEAPILAALSRRFPAEHRSLVAGLAGASGADLDRRLSESLGRFFKGKMDAIVRAPGPMLVALEGRHGALLRAIGREDIPLCALVGDKGFFSGIAVPRSQQAALVSLGVTLVETAHVGAGRTAGEAVRGADAPDLQAWLSRVDAIEPQAQVRRLLADRAFRAAAPPEKLCHGAAAMHEAAVALPPDQGARVSVLLVKSLLDI